MPNIAYLDLKYDRRSTVTTLYDDPFTITALTNNCTINISNISETTDITFKISYDNGMSYEDITIAAQDTLSVNISNAGYSFPLVKTESGHWMSNIRIDSDEGDEFSISGNIMTLVDARQTITAVPGYYFFCLFQDAEDLVDASELRLPATEVGASGYAYMFAGCTNLKKGPAILPATTLDNYCYGYMFQGCTSLITTPVLPATTLAEGCYNQMFEGCSSLTTAPELPATTLAESCYHGMFSNSGISAAPVLPATTLADNCYEEMFIGCGALVTAPALPATTLADYCYRSMFEGCTSLTTAPNLIAENMVEECYKRMFYNCENLNFIRILAKDTATDYITDWVHNVAPFGVFIKDPDTNYTIDSDSGVPIGWTVANEGEDIPVYYGVTLNVDPAGGGTVTGGGAHEINSLVTVKATEAEEYGFVGWYNEDNILLSTNNSYSFMITENVTLTAKFAIDTFYTVTLNSDDPNLDPELIGAGTYEAGTTVTISAPDIMGYTFVGWKNNDVFVLYNQTWTFKIHSNIILSAVYEEYSDFEHEYLTLELTNNSDATSFDFVLTNLKSTSTIDIKVNLGQWQTYSFEDMIYISVGNKYRINTYGTQNALVLHQGDRLQLRRLVKDANNESQYSYISINTSIPPNWAVNTSEYKVHGNIACLDPHHDDLINMNDTYYAGVNLNTMYVPNDNKLAYYECYIDLFMGTNQTDSVAYSSFNNSIIDAKHLVLPYITLNPRAYSYMFRNCKVLQTPPVLPATTLATYCYYNMFNNCESLNEMPALPATTLAEFCYLEMFNGCISLTTANLLPATTLEQHCYDSMFKGCSNLNTAPILPATTLAYECYSRMFEDCTSLVNAPTLPATTLANGCYFNMFSRCTSLRTAPTLPATTLAANCYEGMFQYTPLATAPTLPATTLAYECYSKMFLNCTSLVNAPTLPATTLEQYCYERMFKGCSKLNNAPILPATILRRGCYYNMFYDCTRLRNVTCLATDISAYECTYDWLNNVAYTGTFIKNPSMNNWPSGGSGIPSSWTVQDYTS